MSNYLIPAGYNIHFKREQRKNTYIQYVNATKCPQGLVQEGGTLVSPGFSPGRGTLVSPGCSPGRGTLVSPGFSPGRGGFSVPRV